MYMCVWARERQTQRPTATERKRETHTERKTEREKEKEREKARERESMTRSSVSERSPECGRDSYEELLNFVTTVERGGCSTFIVHARKAILKGLSPKEVHRLLALMVQKYKY